jgi:hypothetical protein
MARVTYESWDIRKADTVTVINRANQILAQYQKGITIRALYYRFIALDYFPDSWIDAAYNAKQGLDGNTKNTVKNYKKLCVLMEKARMAGHVDWDAIVDRTRNLKSLGHWSKPGDIIRGSARAYRLDLWARQPYRLECWIEKDAMIGVIEDVCEENDVPYFSCRGYTSVSEVWGAARRHLEYIKAGQRVVVLHFGDHDPSGLDMTKDIQKRLKHFQTMDWYRECMPRKKGTTKGAIWENMARRVNLPGEMYMGTEVKRLALHMEQVEQYSPPPNPAKESDSRFKKYQEEFGDDSWELDALEPNVIEQLLQDGIDSHRDGTIWNEDYEKQELERKDLTSAADNWNKVVAHLKTL